MLRELLIDYRIVGGFPNIERKSGNFEDPTDLDHGAAVDLHCWAALRPLSGFLFRLDVDYPVTADLSISSKPMTPLHGVCFQSSRQSTNIRELL